MPNAQNLESVKSYKQLISKSICMVVFEFKGVDANSANVLRSSFRNAGSQMHVCKNTLVKIAVKDTDFEPATDLFVEQTAYAITDTDPVAMAKALNEFAKTNSNIKIKGGVLNGKLLMPAQVEALADIPSREVLIAKLLYTLNAPVTGFVNVLAAKIRQVLYVLNAIKEKK
jgi:large subunit ribosomal protein L10